MDPRHRLRVRPHDFGMDTPFAGGSFASQMLAFKGDKAHVLRVHSRGRARWRHPNMPAFPNTDVAAAAMIESLSSKDRIASTMDCRAKRGRIAIHLHFTLPICLWPLYLPKTGFRFGKMLAGTAVESASRNAWKRLRREIIPPGGFRILLQSGRNAPLIVVQNLCPRRA